MGGGGNLIGGPVPAARNVISGNGQHAIYSTQSASASANGFNVIQGNYIGTDASGELALGNGGNGYDGIYLTGVSGNLISNNVASGNTGHAVEIDGPGASGNLVAGNFIGTDATGTNQLGNGYGGVTLVMADGNQIGGTNAASGNVISANSEDGIFITNSVANVMQGNLIGLAAEGRAALANGYGYGGTNYDGVGIFSASSNIIGGVSAAARNVISGNIGDGVDISGPGASGNVVLGNFIGTDATGTNRLGNGYGGIVLWTTDGNQIGGSSAGAGNLISANNGDGIYLTNACWNIIQGNWIGTKSDGTNAVGNVTHGVEPDVYASSNTIGGTLPGAGNTIAYAQTDYAGVRVRAGSQKNWISGNAIFGNGALGKAFGGSVGCRQALISFVAEKLIQRLIFVGIPRAMIGVSSSNNTPREKTCFQKHGVFQQNHYL